MRIGLTGGIGSGKSTVSHVWAEAGVGIVDADLLAREVVAKGSPVLDAISREWPDVVSQGVLDRKALGKIVFNDAEAKEKLNALTHPAVRDLATKRLDMLSEVFDVVAYDCPLLIESGLHKDFDPVVVVYCPIMAQVKRVMDRDSCSEEEAVVRIASQYPLGQKRLLADYVINSNCPLEEFKQRALDTLTKIKKDYGTTSSPPR